MKRFVFLYPQEDIFSYEIEKGSILVTDKWEEERSNILDEEFRTAIGQSKEALQAKARKDRTSYFTPIYKKQLNQCINQRYRNQGFEVNYFLLDGGELSPIIDRGRNDRVLFVGMDAKTHRTKRADETYPYPDQDYMLDQVLPANHIRVAGFHMWDCVEKFARRAHERGVDVLVDEDLTEFFSFALIQPDFKPEVYRQDEQHPDILRARIGKPWLFPEYNSK